MTLKLFNTENRTKEAIVSLRGHQIRMYTCGPTIYNFAHIGNFRTYVFEDFLRRALRFFGFSVEQAMNLTDIDDKTIRGAISQGISLKEFTEPFRIAFFEDIRTLGIERVEHYPAATEYISEMIRLIQTLLEKKIAYRGTSGSIYYAIERFPTYGRLSHFRLEDLQVNASGANEADEYDKESIADFVLWKAYDPECDGNIFWESPFGPGRPGWHIECSAMAMNLLGETVDIHCGGVDNMFPHHENEMAQSEGCTGHRFVRYWIHVEHLLVDHKKMSKSLGNFYTLRDLLQKGYSGKEVRYLLFSTHYRTQLNFTFAGLEGARASLERIGDWVVRLRAVQKKTSEDDALSSLLARARKRFREALADDLNISVALSALFDLLRECNALLDEGKVGEDGAKETLHLLQEWDQVLGVLPLQEEAQPLPHDLTELLKKREKARQSQQYALSDEIRSQILERGYIIEDTPTGARLKKKIPMYTPPSPKV